MWRATAIARRVATIQEQDAYREGYDAEDPPPRLDWGCARPRLRHGRAGPMPMHRPPTVFGSGAPLQSRSTAASVSAGCRFLRTPACHGAGVPPCHALALLVASVVVGAGCFGAVWWRLGAGPINLDILTPWLASAIGDNFGKDHRVEIGGTQIERAGRIRMALRIRDVVVRDRDNAIVATAPKAEVRMSGTRLLMGRLRAESLSLVGAELAVRIEPDGRVMVSAGGDAPCRSPPARGLGADGTGNVRHFRAIIGNNRSRLEPGTAAGRIRHVGGMHGLLAALAWIDGLGVSGLDGHDLNELGLKNGVLVVDDRQSGRTWKFDNITLVLRRPSRGRSGVPHRRGKRGQSVVARVRGRAAGRWRARHRPDRANKVSTAKACCWRCA